MQTNQITKEGHVSRKGEDKRETREYWIRCRCFCLLIDPPVKPLDVIQLFMYGDFYELASFSPNFSCYSDDGAKYTAACVWHSRCIVVDICCYHPYCGLYK